MWIFDSFDKIILPTFILLTNHYHFIDLEVSWSCGVPKIKPTSFYVFIIKYRLVGRFFLEKSIWHDINKRYRYLIFFYWKLKLASLYSNLVYQMLHVTASLACVRRWDLIWIWNKFIFLTFFLTWNKYYHNKAWNRWDDQKGSYSFNNQLQHWVHQQLWKNQGNCFRGRRPELHGWIKGFYRGAKLCLLFYDVELSNNLTNQMSNMHCLLSADTYTWQ